LDLLHGARETEKGVVALPPGERREKAVLITSYVSLGSDTQSLAIV